MTFMKAINRDILKLAVPSILANITVPIVGMVDIAVAGHLDGAVATMIGGIAIGTMLFDLLYWTDCRVSQIFQSEMDFSICIWKYFSLHL